MAKTAGMTERQIQRALYWRHRAAMIMLPNYTPPGWCECDMFIVTNRGFTVEYEIKVTHSDFNRDFRKGKHATLAGKGPRYPVGGWQLVRPPTRFFFAVPVMLVTPRDVPSYAGLVYLSRRGNSPVLSVEVVRQAPRLSKEKLSDEIARSMQRLCYHRFWTERFRFDDYREDARRMAGTNRAMESNDGKAEAT